MAMALTPDRNNKLSRFSRKPLPKFQPNFPQPSQYHKSNEGNHPSLFTGLPTPSSKKTQSVTTMGSTSTEGKIKLTTSTPLLNSRKEFKSNCFEDCDFSIIESADPCPRSRLSIKPYSSPEKELLDDGSKKLTKLVNKLTIKGSNGDEAIFSDSDESEDDDDEITIKNIDKGKDGLKNHKSKPNPINFNIDLDSEEEEINSNIVVDGHRMKAYETFFDPDSEDEAEQKKLSKGQEAMHQAQEDETAFFSIENDSNYETTVVSESESDDYENESESGDSKNEQGESHSQPIPPASSVQTRSSTNFIVPTSEMISELIRIIEEIPDPKVETVVAKPNKLRVKLYDYQVYGLRWLWWREHQYPGGGILADEMGLGKTIMMLALICKGLEEGSADQEQREALESRKSANLRPSRGTLIIVPASLMGQWEIEIYKKSKGLNFECYHGPSRNKLASHLHRFDIVLTTYGIVQSEMPKGYENTSPLAQVVWDRVILDEGQMIRNFTTGTANACCHIHAKHRWVVTGTPVHTRPSDMQSLVKFLRVEPFDDPNVFDHLIGTKKVCSNVGQERLNLLSRGLILRRIKTKGRGQGV